MLPRESFAAAVKEFGKRIVYTPYRGETRSAGTPDREAAHAAARRSDPWDQQPSREQWFLTKLHEQAPSIEVKNLDPWSMPCVSSRVPRKSRSFVKATRISGLGIMEAMRSAQFQACTNMSWGDCRLRLQEARRARCRILRPRRDGHQRRVAPLSRLPVETRRRRPGPLRLRPGLQVLHVGRDQDVSRQRQIHRRSAGALHDLSPPLSGTHDVHSSGQGRRHPAGSGQKDGRSCSGIFIFESEVQGGGRSVRARIIGNGPVFRTIAAGDSDIWSAWRCTT